MSRRRTPAVVARVLSFVAALLIPAAGSAKVVFKVATLAPQGSIWDTTLRALGARWAKENPGQVELRVYPGGVAGDESDVVRKIRIGQFQGAALTVTGLAEIEPAFRLFHLPMFFDSWDELYDVLDELRPDLERRLAAKGYVLLFWGHGGWVHLFSREPIRSLADLKSQKLFVWAGDDEQVQQWRKNGFQPVPIAATDVSMAFQTKMIDVVPTPPVAALTFQWFRQTPYMLGLGLAPLVGGVVVTREAWEKVPQPTREKMMAAARAAEAELKAEVPKLDQGAIEQMKQRGLTVTKLAPEQAAEFRRAADEFAKSAREGKVPPEVLQAARDAVDAYRAAHGPESGDSSGEAP
jgi:TRAP-type C4-dicarboxylate transport system substrate-binding protein